MLFSSSLEKLKLRGVITATMVRGLSGVGECATPGHVPSSLLSLVPLDGEMYWLGCPRVADKNPFQVHHGFRAIPHEQYALSIHIKSNNLL